MNIVAEIKDRLTVPDYLEYLVKIEYIKVGKIRMYSDRYISPCETGAYHQAVRDLIDLKHPDRITRYKIKAL